MSDDSLSAGPTNKKPRGILKNSSSFDQSGAMGGAGNRKSAKFDELNVLQTYHPPGKDYGHMKVEEPKTPYNYADTSDVEVLDAELLAEKLKVAAEASSSSSESEEEVETEEERSKRKEFEKRRKAHYNEYQAVQMARKLMEEEEEEQDDDNAKSKSKLAKMDVEPADGVSEDAV